MRHSTRNEAEAILRRERTEARARIIIATETPVIHPMVLLEMFRSGQRDAAWDLLAALDEEQLYHCASAVASHIDGAWTEDVLERWRSILAARQQATPADLAESADTLAALQPDDAAHYRRAAHYLRTRDVSHARTSSGYSIQRDSETVHTISLNSNDAPGIQRHGCTCANPRCCWARALAETLEAWKERAEEDALLEDYDEYTLEMEEAL
jgi:hypothetical protein